MLYGGTYYIKYGSQYVVSNPSTSNVELSNSKGLNALWSFEKMSKGRADFHVDNDAKWGVGYTFSGIKNHFGNFTSGMGYSPNINLNASVSSALNSLKSSDIWAVARHGGSGYIDFQDALLYGNNISNLSPNSLAGVRCMITLSCSGGTTGINMGNIVDASYDRGAQFALGFTTDTLTIPVCEWLREFLKAANKGYTVQASIDAAFKSAGNPTASQAGKAYYRGDAYQILNR